MPYIKRGFLGWPNVPAFCVYLSSDGFVNDEPDALLGHSSQRIGIGQSDKNDPPTLPIILLLQLLRLVSAT